MAIYARQIEELRYFCCLQTQQMCCIYRLVEKKVSADVYGARFVIYICLDAF